MFGRREAGEIEWSIYSAQNSWLGRNCSASPLRWGLTYGSTPGTLTAAEFAFSVLAPCLRRCTAKACHQLVITEAQSESSRGVGRARVRKQFPFWIAPSDAVDRQFACSSSECRQ